MSLIGPERSTLITRSTRALSDLRQATGRYDRAQMDIVDLQRIRTPADDPSGAGRIMAIDAETALFDSYERSIGDARARAEVADGALETATRILVRVKELTLQAANGTLNASQRQAIASEVRALADEFLASGNARYGNDHVFAGVRPEAAPYATMDLDDAAAPDVGALIREIDAGVSVGVSVSAADAFEPGRAALAAVVRALDDNDVQAVASALGGIDTGVEAVADQRALLGARAARIDAAESSLGERRATFEELRSTIADTDLAEAITRLRRAEVTVQAALQTSARVLGMSIFDYLR